MEPAVQDVHQRDRKDMGVLASQISIKRFALLNGLGLGCGHGNGQNGIGAKLGLVLRAVQVDHDFVERHEVGFHPLDLLGDGAIDIGDGLQDPFTLIARLVPIPQFQGLVLARGRS